MHSIDDFHILLIDNNPLLRKVFRDTGRKKGYDIDAIASVHMIDREKRYDLILIDYMMRPSGPETLKIIQNLYPDASCIYYTQLQDIKDPEIPVINKSIYRSIADILTVRRTQCTLLKA